MINLMEQMDDGIAHIRQMNWRPLGWTLGAFVGFGAVVTLFTKSDAFAGLVMSVPGLALIVLGILIYFSPAILAYQKKKGNKQAILALNFFLGWTLVGWVVALVWACTQNDTDKSVAVALPSVLCASCGKYSGNGGSFCPHCGGKLSSV